MYRFPFLLQKIDFIEAASAGSLQGVCDALKAGVHVDATVITGSFDNKVCYGNSSSFQNLCTDTVRCIYSYPVI